MRIFFYLMENKTNYEKVNGLYKEIDDNTPFSEIYHEMLEAVAQLHYWNVEDIFTLSLSLIEDSRG